MGLTHYGFALFIFVLLCLFALICRLLFSSVKKQQLNLEEKEKKLLALYSTLEETMDDFTDSMQRSRKELDFKMQEIREIINGYKNRLTTLPPGSGSAPTTPYPEAVSQASSQRSAASTSSKSQPAPTSAAPKTTVAPSPPPAATTAQASASTTPNTNTTPPLASQPSTQPSPPAKPDASERASRILALANQGYDRVRIAKELSVTLSEIDLVLGIQRTKK